MVQEFFPNEGFGFAGLEAQCSWLMPQGSWLKALGSWPEKFGADEP